MFPNIEKETVGKMQSQIIIGFLFALAVQLALIFGHVYQLWYNIAENRNVSILIVCFVSLWGFTHFIGGIALILDEEQLAYLGNQGIYGVVPGLLCAIYGFVVILRPKNSHDCILYAKTALDWYDEYVGLVMLDMRPNQGELIEIGNTTYEIDYIIHRAHSRTVLLLTEKTI